LPRHTFEGRNNVTSQEVDSMLQACNNLKNPLRMKAIICLLWIFGARINEVLSLRMIDLFIRGRAQEKYLHVSFIVQKKKSKFETMQPKPYVKKITSQNHFVKPIIEYYIERNKKVVELVQTGKVLDVDSQFLFPSHLSRQNKTHTVSVKHYFRLNEGKLEKLKHSEKDKATETRVYNYTRKNGHLSYWRFRQEFRKITTAWAHLFRTSRCTEFAESGATIWELLDWFSWDRPSTALEYIKHASSYSSKFSKRRF
jgi:integrase